MKILRPCIAIALLLAPLGCGGDDSNPPLADVAKQYGASYCKKLAECMGNDAFELAYPGGRQDCATRSYRIYGTTERSICSQEWWDTCSKDLEASTCILSSTDLPRPKIPDTCLCQ